MKKLIAILAVFALLTTAVFADVNFGGSIGMGAILLQGDTTDDSDITADMAAMWSSLWWNWSNDDNTAGAKIGIDADLGDIDTNGGDGFAGNLWWRPIQQIKLDVFKDDGAFYRGNAIAWGYHANSAAGNVATIGDWNDSGWNSFSGGVLSGDCNVGFFRGYMGDGMALHIYPMDGLELGLGLPFGGALEDINITGHLGYTINGIGKLNASFRRNYDFASWVGWEGNLRAPTVGIDFTTWALPGINIEIGALIPLKGEFLAGWWYDEFDNETDLPISIGVGFTMNQWSGEAFHLYARAGVMLPADLKINFDGYPWGGGEFYADYSDTMVIGLGINPSYGMDFGRIYFDFGIGMVMKGDDSDLYWHFNPYLRKSLGIGDLYVGFNLWNGTGMGGYEAFPTIFGEDSTGVINFALPIYFQFGF
jgi:hypothetical protein